LLDVPTSSMAYTYCRPPTLADTFSVTVAYEYHLNITSLVNDVLIAQRSNPVVSYTPKQHTRQKIRNTADKTLKTSKHTHELKCRQHSTHHRTIYKVLPRMPLYLMWAIA